jgi:hypothetical protein
MKKNREMIMRPLQTIIGEIQVPQRPADGYIHLNPIADASGKSVAHWLENKDTKEYLSELSLDSGIPISKLVIVIRGRGDVVNQGTWAHIQAALKFAGWCNKKFEVQVFKWLESWLKDRGRTIGDTMRLFFNNDPTPYEKLVPKAFWEEMERLYNVKYYPEKGAPEGSFPATLIKRLIISRLPADFQECLEIVNPRGENGKRKQKHHQWLKPGRARDEYEKTIQDCIHFMKQCTHKEQFEKLWSILGPNNDKQLSLIDPRYYLDN